MDNEKALACAAFVVMSCEFLRMKKLSRRKRRWWMVSRNKSRTRDNASDILEDLKREPSGKFENFCRMSATDFEYLLNKIGPMIEKTDTNMRKAITVQERLAVTLRFLASGESFTSLSFLFKFSSQTVSRSVHDVCNALILALQDEITMPTTSQEWLKIAKEYDENWNFPHCVGSIDGRHIIIHSSMCSGSKFLNYKGSFSVVLMAIVDADYCFKFADIGCEGRISGGGIFRNTTLMLPPHQPLPSKELPIPYVFVADDAFALSPHIMKPYCGTYDKGSAERAFNYRLSRAHQVVENVFGIMSSVFRVLRKPLLLEPDRASDITLTCVLLHNFLRKSMTSFSRYSPQGAFDIENEGEVIAGSWRQDQNDMSSLLPLHKTPRKAELEAKTIREAFAEFFTTSGKVPWQDKYC